jgi:hypothetical protein
MEVNLKETISLLEQTPQVMRALLDGLPDDLIRCNEGPGTWSAFDVLGHLIHGEKTDWVPRAKIILNEGEKHPFDPFDREAMLESSKGKNLAELLEEFDHLRRENLETLRAMNLSSSDYERKGMHPALGSVTLGELLATWVVHDLDHLTQVLRVRAKHFGSAVGPWKAYLSVLDDRIKK